VQLCGISKEKIVGDTPPHMDDIDDLSDFYRSVYFNTLRNIPVTDKYVFYEHWLKDRSVLKY